MFNVGPMEALVIFVVALLVFGPKKLPELGKSLGRGLAEFRRASQELRGSLEREMENIEHEARMRENEQQAKTYPATPAEPEPHAQVMSEHEMHSVPPAEAEASHPVSSDHHELHS